MKKKNILKMISVGAVVAYTMGPALPEIQNVTLLAKPTQLQKPTVQSANSLANNNIELYGQWGGNYKVVDIGFNTDTMKLTATIPSKGLELCGYTWLNAYTVSMYNNAGQLISTKSFKGGETNDELANYVSNLTFNYGDSIKIQSRNLVNSVNAGTVSHKDLNLQLTKEGLVNLKDGITGLKALYNNNGTVVSGTTKANTDVYVIADNKVYTTTSDANGNFECNLPESVKDGAAINVEPNGYAGQRVVSVTNTNEFPIMKDSIQINNGWGSRAGNISFNPINMKFDVSQYNEYLGHNKNDFLNIKVYDTKNSTLLLNGDLKGNDNTSYLDKLMKGKSFNYGDVIELSYDNTQGRVSVLNDAQNIGNTNGKKEYFEITSEGLKAYTPKIKLNAFDVLSYYKVTQGVVSGKAPANKDLTVTAGGQTFKCKANANGYFSTNVVDANGFTSATEVSVCANTGIIVNTMPVQNSSIKLQDSSVVINNGWGTPAAKMTFNPLTRMIHVSGSNPYLGSNDNHFLDINLFNIEHGTIVSSSSFKGNSTVKDLEDALSGKSFNYGDVIEFSYNKDQGKVHVLNGSQNIGNTDGNKEYFEITTSGLKVFNPSMSVNPFDILGTNNLNSGTLTGKAPANIEIKVSVDGKNFVTKANSKGNFSVNINDVSGFNATTKIIIEANGEMPVVINPSVNKNLKINNASVTFKNQWHGDAIKISFNPATMQIDTKQMSGDFGTSQMEYFNVKLIGNKDGKILDDVSTNEDKTAGFVNSFNNLKFEYGDIIAVNENHEIGLSLGQPVINDGSGKNISNCLGQTQYLEITPGGLVQVQNKNLSVENPIFTGGKTIAVKGKTLVNKEVTAWFNGKSYKSKSDANGAFIINVPTDDMNVGSQIRIYVNSENNKLITVACDTKIFNIANNKITILNNTNVPLMNMTFNPLDNKIVAVSQPMSKNYTGNFYEGSIKISILNPQTSQVIYTFEPKTMNDLQGFVNSMNGKSFTMNDIVEISYNHNFASAQVFDGKNSIGNTTGQTEYFQITNKGLIQANNDFMTVNPLNILGNGKVNNAKVTGKIYPNSFLWATIDGENYVATADNKGNFTIDVRDANGFTANTQIAVSSPGYNSVIITPGLAKGINIQHSFINLYNQEGYKGAMTSNITLNPSTMKFVVNNSADSYGNGQSPYLDFNLYNKTGNQILGANINNGASSQLSNALDGKSFNYGDIIGLSYNTAISKPVIFNGKDFVGNVTGEMEYFEITKNGLVKVDFGQSANANSIYWSGDNLVIDATLASGQSKSVMNASKKLVLVNQSGNIVATENMNSFSNDNSKLQGTLSNADLSKVDSDSYKIEIDINGQLFPIQVNCNIPSNSKYNIGVNSNSDLTVSLVNKVVNINNAISIASYNNDLNKSLSTVIDNNQNISTMLNSKKFSNDVIASEFINRIGVSNLENFFNASKENQAFIDWVLNNTTAMSEYLNGPKPNGTSLQPGQKDGTDIDVLNVWSKIWNNYSNSRSGFNLKLAIAVSLTNATVIPAWPDGNSNVGSPVQRYNIFENLNEEGGLLPVFKTLNVREIGYVVNSRLPNSQIITARDVILNNHNGFINAKDIYKVDYTIDYNLFNPYTGANVQSGNYKYYGKNPTILDVWKDGGVCGAISKLGSAACQIFGVPARPIGQPGHCAFVYYDGSQWNIGNNIYGWEKSNGSDISGWSKGISSTGNIVGYDLLYSAANTPALVKSNEYLWLENSATSYNAKMNVINEAIKVQPLNMGAWIAKLKLMQSNSTTTLANYNEFNKDVISTFGQYPMPMFDLLLQDKNQIIEKGSLSDFYNYVNQITNALNSVTTPDQVKTAEYILTLMSNFGLKKGIGVSNIQMVNVWNQEIGTISASSKDMTLSVAKGWGQVNPYLHSEAFSISLESANGKVIKTLTANGGQRIENALYNTFNGQKFEYGYKIVIDYKTSSKISIINPVRSEKILPTQKVDKPMIVTLTKYGFEI